MTYQMGKGTITVRKIEVREMLKFDATGTINRSSVS